MTHRTLRLRSYAQVQAASAESSCDKAIQPPQGQGAMAQWDDPEQPATVSLKPARRAPRPDANWNRLVRLALFLNYFDLFIDHLPGEAIDRNVHPVMLLPLDVKVAQII